MPATPHRDRTFRFVHALSVADAFGDVYVMANSDRLFSPSLRRAAAAVGSDKIADVPVDEATPLTAQIAGRWQQPLIEFAAGVPSLPLNDAGMTANQDQRRRIRGADSGNGQTFGAGGGSSRASQTDWNPLRP